MPPHNRNPRTHKGHVPSGGSVLQAPLACHRTELQPEPAFAEKFLGVRRGAAPTRPRKHPCAGQVFASGELSFLNVSTERNHTHALWCLRLAPLTRHRVFPSHPRPRVSTSFPPVAERSPRLDRITLVLALQRCWTFRSFQCRLL